MDTGGTGLYYVFLLVGTGRSGLYQVFSFVDTCDTGRYCVFYYLHAAYAKQYAVFRGVELTGAGASYVKEYHQHTVSMPVSILYW